MENTALDNCSSMLDYINGENFLNEAVDWNKQQKQRYINQSIRDESNDGKKTLDEKAKARIAVSAERNRDFLYDPDIPELVQALRLRYLFKHCINIKEWRDDIRAREKVLEEKFGKGLYAKDQKLPAENEYGMVDPRLSCWDANALNPYIFANEGVKSTSANLRGSVYYSDYVLLLNYAIPHYEGRDVGLIIALGKSEEHTLKKTRYLVVEKSHDAVEIVEDTQEELRRADFLPFFKEGFDPKKQTYHAGKGNIPDPNNVFYQPFLPQKRLMFDPKTGKKTEITLQNIQFQYKGQTVIKKGFASVYKLAAPEKQVSLINIEVADGCYDLDDKTAERLLGEIYECLAANKAISINCAAGRGRTGAIVLAFFLYVNFEMVFKSSDPEDNFKKIQTIVEQCRSARGGLVQAHSQLIGAIKLAKYWHALASNKQLKEIPEDAKQIHWTFEAREKTWHFNYRIAKRASKVGQHEMAKYYFLLAHHYAEVPYQKTLAALGALTADSQANLFGDQAKEGAPIAYTDYPQRQWEKISNQKFNELKPSLCKSLKGAPVCLFEIGENYITKAMQKKLPLDEIKRAKNCSELFYIIAEHARKTKNPSLAEHYYFISASLNEDGNEKREGLMLTLELALKKQRRNTYSTVRVLRLVNFASEKFEGQFHYLDLNDDQKATFIQRIILLLEKSPQVLLDKAKKISARDPNAARQYYMLAYLMGSDENGLLEKITQAYLTEKEQLRALLPRSNDGVINSIFSSYLQQPSRFNKISHFYLRLAESFFSVDVGQYEEKALLHLYKMGLAFIKEALLSYINYPRGDDDNSAGTLKDIQGINQLGLAKIREFYIGKQLESENESLSATASSLESIVSIFARMIEHSQSYQKHVSTKEDLIAHGFNKLAEDLFDIANNCLEFAIALEKQNLVPKVKQALTGRFIVIADKIVGFCRHNILLERDTQREIADAMKTACQKIYSMLNTEGSIGYLASKILSEVREWKQGVCVINETTDYTKNWNKLFAGNCLDKLFLSDKHLQKLAFSLKLINTIYNLVRKNKVNDQKQLLLNLQKLYLRVLKIYCYIKLETPENIGNNYFEFYQKAKASKLRGVICWRDYNRTEKQAIRDTLNAYLKDAICQDDMSGVFRKHSLVTSGICDLNGKLNGSPTQRALEKYGKFKKLRDDAATKQSKKEYGGIDRTELKYRKQAYQQYLDKKELQYPKIRTQPN